MAPRSIDTDCYLNDLSMSLILPTRHKVQENHAHLQGMWQNQWIPMKMWVWLTWQAWSWPTPLELLVSDGLLGKP